MKGYRAITFKGLFVLKAGFTGPETSRLQSKDHQVMACSRLQHQIGDFDLKPDNRDRNRLVETNLHNSGGQPGDREREREREDKKKQTRHIGLPIPKQ